MQDELLKKGFRLNILRENRNTSNRQPVIELSLIKEVDIRLNEEGYHLTVSSNKIQLIASTEHGVFNGIQTLLQLMRDGAMVDNCVITDWPAFSWRGYMVDVGRNYQSVGLLKQQIEKMAHYKLNVFHFHFTEDIAWRLASKLYPQLTAPENMLRNKGMYYTETELKDIIAFCKRRFITLVPEIDMPGHSAAFARAMKTNMQSDSGLIIVKNILQEFFATYDLPYLHIGADEVKITNAEFLPQVIAYAKQFGKKIIGWEPGGNFTDDVIRQLWMDDAGKIASNTSFKYIDARHLYLNHMDPLEAVTTIFNRRILNHDKGDSLLLGGTICLWPDRAVAKETDVLIMNAVYPAMLTFAERSWRGGGQEGWVANIGAPGTAEVNRFTEFESRLLDQQQKNFEGLAFPYARQSTSTWKLYGPYDNNGDLSTKFDPEQKGFAEKNISAAMELVGGTIVLKHWWFPLIKGAIAHPAENTTWYASKQVWSDADTLVSYWIGFNNLSRSTATQSPPAGAWDDKQSQVWINGNLVAPPSWRRPGGKGSLEIPLGDEGYEYRNPTKLKLRKGWNTILVKAPVGSFKGTDWQNPVKWMFTVVQAPDAC